MDTLNLTELKALYRGTPQQVPRAIYNSYGDYLGIIITSDSYVTERIDEHLTIHRNDEGAVVGCTIKGLSVIAKSIVEQYRIEDDVQIELRVVFSAMHAVTGRFSRHYCDFPMQDFAIPLKTLAEAAA